MEFFIDSASLNLLFIDFFYDTWFEDILRLLFYEGAFIEEAIFSEWILWEET